MSHADLYSGAGPLIASGGGEPQATVFGVPFDSTHSYRPGTRFGPDAIRSAFNNIEVYHPSSGVDLEGVAIRDLGNLQHTVVAPVMLEMVGKVTAELRDEGRPIMILGGEHSITLGSYARFPKSTGYVVFDAHYDLRDSYADQRHSHASYLRRLAEERGSDSMVHVGARAFAREEHEFLAGSKMATVTDAQVRTGEAAGALRDAVSPFDSVYVSFDLDVVDPGYAPGVGNPEAAGITPRELFGLIGALSDVRVECADIVELNPEHDTGATAALAARIMSVMLERFASR